MAWTRNNTTKVWTHAGTGRDVVIASTEQPARTGVVLECVTSADEVVAVLFASPDGCTRYEAGIVGSNVVIQEVVFNAAPVVLTNGSTGDVPGAGSCSIAHGLTAGVPFKLAVYVYDSTIEVLIDGVQKLVHRVLETEYSVVNVQTSGHVHFGFASSIAGAVVQSAKTYDLVDAEPGPATEVLFAVCDRNVWYSVDGVNIQPIAGSGGGVGAFGDGLVELMESDGVVYGLGGGYARKIDAATLQVTAWTATAGTFPGSSGLGSGQTRMRFLGSLVSRLVLAGDKTDPQNAYLPKIGDQSDFDVTDELGAAYALNTSYPGKVGQPITCIAQVSAQAMLIGCVSQTWIMAGDLAAGLPDLQVLSLTSGISGPRAAALADDGVAIAHSPDGMLIIAGGVLSNLSAGVLSEGIQIPRASIYDYYITIAREPWRHLTFVFVTPVDGSQGLHFAYSERVGGFQRGEGGFFPVVFGDNALQPVSACMFRGKLLLGTLDGRIVNLDDTVTTDDGEDFDSLISVAIPMGGANLDTILRRLSIVPSLASESFDWTIYGGRTPEEAFDGTSRVLIRSGTFAAGAPMRPEVIPLRAPCMVLELSASGTRLQVEAVMADVTAGSMQRRWIPTAKAAPHAKCDIEATTDDGDDFGDGGGVGDAFILYLIESELTEFAASQEAWALIGVDGLPTASGNTGGDTIDANTTLGGGGIIITHD